MNRLTQARRAQVVSALVEGNSVRSTCRMTGVAKGTVLKLLADLGTACREYQDATLRTLPCKRLQCDEVWSFCGAKDKNIRPERRGEPGLGSVWTWTALCADTKLIAAFHIGTRDAFCARHFIGDLAKRLRHRVQLTTDGHKAYLEAIDDAFATQVDYAMLIKLYGTPLQDEARYSPPE